MPECDTAENYHALKIRDSAIAHGEGLRRHFLTDKRGGAKYAAMGYMQRLQTVESETGDIKGRC